MKKKVVLFFLSLILLIVFIYFSYLVAKETFTQIDFDTTVKFQDKLPRKVDFPFSVLSVIGSAEITGIFWLILLVMVTIKKYWYTSIGLLLLPAALAIEIFGKLFVFHPGPPHLFYRGVIKFDLPSHYVPVDYSYPSGHVLRTTFLITFIMTWIFLKVRIEKQFFIQPIMLAILAAMFISRIYLGEHWLSDVIGGLIIGSSFGVFAALWIPQTNKNI